MEVVSRAVEFFKRHEEFKFIYAPEEFKDQYDAYVKIGRLVVTGKWE